MLLRAAVVWFALMVIAIVNGAFRGAVLVPSLGEEAGRFASTLLLCALIAAVAWLTIRWIHPATARAAAAAGALWLAMTAAFEFLAGHYVFGQPWDRLLGDYDVTRGRIWVLVLVTTAVAPWWAARARRP